MTINWYQIFLAIILLFFGLVYPNIVKLIKAIIRKYNLETAVDWMKKAVKAAEQQFKESGQGKEKRSEVINFISNWLLQNGINLTYDEIDKLLEATVYELNHPKEEE